MIGRGRQEQRQARLVERKSRRRPERAVWTHSNGVADGSTCGVQAPEQTAVLVIFCREAQNQAHDRALQTVTECLLPIEEDPVHKLKSRLSRKEGKRGSFS